MSNDVGLINLVIPPILNRIGRDERLDAVDADPESKGEWICRIVQE